MSSVFGGSTAIAVVGVALLVLSCTAVVQCTQLEKADAIEEKLKEDNQRLAQTIDDEKAARAETERRFNAQRNIANEAQRQLDRVAGNNTAALESSQRLFRQLEADLARARRPSGDSAAVAAGEAASDTFVVSADLYRTLLGRARRLDERARQFGALADDRGIRGAACEREYDALRF